MRHVAIFAGLLIIASGIALGIAPGVASATPAEDLQAKGQQFAKDGRYTEAIDAFKAADRIKPRAENACLIALAYTRRELWPQAEMFLHLCHDRASATDPMPDWVAAADAQIAERMTSANVALVEIHVTPDVPVKLTVSSFALDEVLSQRTIHLPFGRVQIFATADGYEPTHQDLVISDRSNKQVNIELHKLTAGQPSITTPTIPTIPTTPTTPTTQATKTPTATSRAERPRASNVPWVVAGAGGVLLIGGVVSDLAWAQPLRTKLMTTSPTVYAANSGSFDTARSVTYGMYGVGAAAAIVGVILHYTVFNGPADTQMRLTGDTVNGGAVIQLEWSR